MFGLVTTHDEPMRKRSGFLTNNFDIAQTLNKTCDFSHSHQHVMGRDRGASINRSRMAQKYPVKLIMAILAAFANSIGLPHDLLYVIDGQRTIEAEEHFELSLVLCGELAENQALLPFQNMISQPGTARDPLDQGCGGPGKCADRPAEPESLHDLLAVNEAEDQEPPESVAAAERENFPGSHPLSLEALVKRAYD
jgi:hypothetical protein